MPDAGAAAHRVAGDRVSDDIPVAIVRTPAQRRRRISLIWTIPIVTALVAAWLACDTLAQRGQEITNSIR